MDVGHRRFWRAAVLIVSLLVVAVFATACLSSDSEEVDLTPTKPPRPASAKVPALPTNTNTPLPTAPRRPPSNPVPPLPPNLRLQLPRLRLSPRQSWNWCRCPGPRLALMCAR